MILRLLDDYRCFSVVDTPPLLWQYPAMFGLFHKRRRHLATLVLEYEMAVQDEIDSIAAALQRATQVLASVPTPVLPDLTNLQGATNTLVTAIDELARRLA